MVAVSEVMDVISASNAAPIPNWRIFGSLRGKLVNNRILNNFLRIILEDMPQIALQAWFIH
jgi:hypothetical protein